MCSNLLYVFLYIHTIKYVQTKPEVFLIYFFNDNEQLLFLTKIVPNLEPFNYSICTIHVFLYQTMYTLWMAELHVWLTAIWSVNVSGIWWHRGLFVWLFFLWFSFFWGGGIWRKYSSPYRTILQQLYGLNCRYGVQSFPIN